MLVARVQVIGELLLMEDLRGIVIVFVRDAGLGEPFLITIELECRLLR